MTTQTKVFIELSDITGLKVTCAECEVDVTIPIKRDMSFKGMIHCPNCGKPWLAVGPISKEPEIANYVNAIVALSDIMKIWQETLITCGNKGFSLSLEIKHDSPEDE